MTPSSRRPSRRPVGDGPAKDYIIECVHSATRSGATITLAYRLKSTKKIKRVSASIKAKSSTTWKPAPTWNLDLGQSPNVVAKCPRRSHDYAIFKGKAVTFRLAARVTGGGVEQAEPFDVGIRAR